MKEIKNVSYYCYIVEIVEINFSCKKIRRKLLRALAARKLLRALADFWKKNYKKKL